METRLQTLYWQSQSIHDKLFSLEHMMRKIVAQGKTCIQTQTKYFVLLDELRAINAEMLTLES